MPPRREDSGSDGKRTAPHTENSSADQCETREPFDLQASATHRQRKKSCLLRKTSYNLGMVNLTIKVPAELKQQLELHAKQSGRSVSALIREAVSRGLRKTTRAASLYDRTRDLCGTRGSGMPDLATNPAHLRGFGQ